MSKENASAGGNFIKLTIKMPSKPPSPANVSPSTPQNIEKITLRPPPPSEAPKIPQLKLRMAAVNEPFPYSYEEQAIFRFPESIASELAKEVEEHGRPLDFSLEFREERIAKVTWRGTEYTALLLDLPCILETQKTFDKSQYYKIADISQLLLVLSPSLSSQDIMMRIEEYKKLSWKFSHGISPPLYNVRKNRFRKLPNSCTAEEIQSIEMKVEELLEKDEKALYSHFSITDSDGKCVVEGGDDVNRLMSIENEQGEPSEIGVDTISDMTEAQDDEMLEDLNYSEDFAAELEESLLTTTTTTLEETVAPIPREPSKSPAIIQLETRISERKQQLRSVTNPMIKERLESVIKDLERTLQDRQSS